MAYGSLAHVIDLVHYTRRKKIRDILHNHTVIPGSWEHPNPYYTHSCYRCDKCNRLYNRFYVKIQYDNDFIYETIFKCNLCKNQLKEFDPASISDLQCPKCGKTSLITSGEMDWD